MQTLFTNVRIIDGSGSAPRDGEVLVTGNRIEAVGERPGSLRTAADAAVIDGGGATLMPGLVEAHLSFHEAHPEPGAVGIGAGYFPPAQLEPPLVRWLEGSGQLFGAKLKDELTVPPDFFYVGNASLKRELDFDPGLARRRE